MDKKKAVSQTHGYDLIPEESGRFPYRKKSKKK